MKKLDFLSRTIKDDIVCDGLCAIGTLSDKELTRGFYMIVGGMATQSYLPRRFMRPTVDIDLSIGKPLNDPDFREFSQGVRGYLCDNGYNIKTKKGSRAYTLEVISKDDKILLIEFARRNQKCFEKSEKRLKRELDNSRSKKVEGKEVIYIVSSPEDIVLPKLVRCTHALSRCPNLESYLLRLEKGATEEETYKQLRKIQEKRREAIFNPGEVILAEELRFMSDIYDIGLLYDVVGFNEAYLKEGLKDWDTLKENTKESKKIRELIPILF